MKVLVTGSNGMLGKHLVQKIGASQDVAGLGRGPNRNPGLKYFECDICDQARVRSIVDEARSDWVVHAAAMTEVDDCEKSTALAEKINGEGSRNVASAVKEAGARGILISTDFIFDGKKSAPYIETDQPHPLNVYGRSKLKAEQYWNEILHDGIVLRSSWLFGRYGKNFVKTIREKLTRGEKMEVVCDQWGAPTSAGDLAEAVLRILGTEGNGNAAFPSVLHYTNNGATSRFDWARFIARQLGYQEELIKPIRSAELGTGVAARPVRGVLDIGLWRKTFKDTPKDIWSATNDYLRSAIDEHEEW